MISGAPLETGAGIEKFIKILITQKELTKFDFTLVFPYFNKEDLNEQKDIPNLTYFPIKMPFPLERKITKTFNSIIFNFTLIFYYFFRLKNCIEVIHINGVNGALLSLFARKKCVFTIHGNSLDSFTNTRFKKINIASITQFLNFLYFFALENLAYLLSNKVITVSKQSMKHFLLFHKREYTYIPIGIEARLDAIDIEERNKKFQKGQNTTLKALWIGRNPERKGLNIALNTVVKSKRTKLFVIGYDERKSVNDKINYLGSLSEIELEEMYKNADLLIFPSSYEAMSVTILEAISFGLPILCFDRSYNTSILGMKYPGLCKNEEDFIKHLRLIEDDPIYFQFITRETLNLIPKYSSTKMALAYEIQYEEIKNEV